MVLPLPRGGAGASCVRGLGPPTAMGERALCVYSHSCPAVACSCFTCLWCDTRGGLVPAITNLECRDGKFGKANLE